MYESKVEANKSWVVPTSCTEVRSFYGLASLCYQFIKDLSSITLTKCKKKETFVSINATKRTLEAIKHKLCSIPLLTLPNLGLLFKVECDSSCVGIKVILAQSQRTLAFFSKKFSGPKFNYFIFYKEFYVIIWALTLPESLAQV